MISEALFTPVQPLGRVRSNFDQKFRITKIKMMFVPAIATSFPQRLQAEARATTTEDVDDSMNRLEEDPYKATPEEEQDQDSLEKDELSKPQKK